MKIDKTEFQALITYYMTKRGLKGLNELSESTLISYKTLLKYWKDPEKFPLGEVGRIMDALRIPPGEFLEKVMKDKGGRKSGAEEDFQNSMRLPTSGSSHSRRPVYNMADIRPGKFQRTVKN